MFLINRHQGCFLIFPFGIWFIAKISPNLAYVSYKVFLVNHNECTVHREKDTKPIIVKLAKRMVSSITVKNFMERMDRLKELTEDEFNSTTEITSFISQIIPISHPEAINDDDNNLYKVAVEVQLLRQVSWYF